jgi:Glycosyl hydrolases family 43
MRQGVHIASAAASQYVTKRSRPHNELEPPMYHPTGEYVTDFCIVRSAESFHLFHIRGERWTWPLGYREIDLGHAISADLCTWTQQPPVLGPGAPGAWDATGIWAPDIIEADSYYLFYSAKGGPKSKGFPANDFAHFDIGYLVAATPSGPWVRPANHTLLERWTCASEHPTFDGVTYMLYIVQEQLGNIWGASFLSDPKRLAWLPDGTVAIHEHLPAGIARRDLLAPGVHAATGLDQPRQRMAPQRRWRA